MYNMDKDKLCRRHHKNPSFSSTLLDEIYRSIDGYDQRREDLKLETRKPKANSNTNTNKKKSIEDEEIASFRRACLIEKWMENKVKDKVVMSRRVPSHHELENDPLIFSSTSSESNSGTLSASSSEPDYSFYSDKSSTTTTCFAAPTTKSIRRASVSPRRPTQLYSFDNQQPLKNEENNLIKSKSRALKMYNNLKKVKQPISPGGRLTTFLTSIFNNKSKNPNGGKRGDFHQVDDRKPKSSISSSLSRSCLSKTPPKFTQNGIKRTVRFNPVSVIVDEDCRPCGHKSIYDQDSDDLPRHKSQGNAEKNRKFEVDSLKSHKIVDYAEEEDDDASSCSSSDLFEIDHLALFGNKRFCEELPVYETTHVDTNRGIATGFIR